MVKILLLKKIPFLQNSTYFLILMNDLGTYCSGVLVILLQFLEGKKNLCRLLGRQGRCATTLHICDMRSIRGRLVKLQHHTGLILRKKKHLVKRVTKYWNTSPHHVTGFPNLESLREKVKANILWDAHGHHVMHSFMTLCLWTVKFLCKT